MIRNPVCLMELDPHNAKSLAEYKGRSDCFCSTHIVASFGDEDVGARLIYDADPQRLIATLSETCLTIYYKHPSCFCRDSSLLG